MVHQVHIHHVPPSSLPGIHQVSTDNPWTWLAAGWGDFVKAPVISLAYGFIVSLIMWVAFYVLQTSDFYASALALVAGFVFIGPLLAVGLYEISHRLEQRLPVSLSDTRRAWRRNTKAVLAIGLVMLLMYLGWFILSAQTTMLIYAVIGDAGPVIWTTVDWQTFVLSVRLPMIMTFGIIGSIAVSITYVITVVSVPMLIDKEDMDTITAIVTSIHTVRKNPAPMILWAGLIAVFTGVAVAPLFLGLVIVFPLLAYSSWHAYRDLIEH